MATVLLGIDCIMVKLLRDCQRCRWMTLEIFSLTRGYSKLYFPLSIFLNPTQIIFVQVSWLWDSYSSYLRAILVNPCLDSPTHQEKRDSPQNSPAHTIDARISKNHGEGLNHPRDWINHKMKMTKEEPTSQTELPETMFLTAMTDTWKCWDIETEH